MYVWAEPNKEKGAGAAKKEEIERMVRDAKKYRSVDKKQK
jgi:hypothetical protein